MLEKITNTFSDIFKKMSGNSKITEKNIEDAVEQIKIAACGYGTPLQESLT